MNYCQGPECLVIQFFGFWCASRSPTLTHIDLSGGVGKASARQQVLLLRYVGDKSL